MTIEHDASESTNGEAGGFSRRTFLKASTVTAVGVGGGLAVTGSAYAKCTDWADAPSDYPTIDLTGSSPSTAGDFPTGADEFTIFVHGWDEEEQGGGENMGYTLEGALEANGYSQGTVTAMWRSNVGWSEAKANADEDGDKLAAWLDSYLSSYDTTVRIVPHSLGNRVTLRALNTLEGAHVIPDVALLGAAVNPDTVCDGGKYEPGITNSAGEVYNYHSTSDDIVCDTYAWSEGTSGLGCEGSECDCGWWCTAESSLSNYDDVDVSDTVAEHGDYFIEGCGCIPEVLSNW